MGRFVAFQAYLLHYMMVGTNWAHSDLGARLRVPMPKLHTNPTGFAPVNSLMTTQVLPVSHLTAGNLCWRRIEEEHVAPHIGITAAFRDLPESERTTRTAAPLNHSSHRIQETRDVIDRMATLDYVKKMQVEAFDNKILIANSVFGAFVLKGLTDGYMD